MTTLVIDAYNHKVKTSRFSHPGATILARDEKTISIKIPAYYFTAGIRGMTRTYSPAETVVYSINKNHGVHSYGFSGYGEGLDVTELLRWSHEKVKK